MSEPRVLRLNDGAEIAWVAHGAGQPVLFVPGWTMSHEVFAHQLGHLGYGFRTIAFDPRSHGRSSRWPSSNDYRQQGRDIAEIVEALGLVDVHLVGWSYGAIAAYAYLDQFGDARVRSFTAIDMTPRPLGTGAPDEWSEGDLELFLRDYVTPCLADPAGFAAGFSEWMVARELTSAERAWLTGMHLGCARHVAMSLQVSAMHADYRELAARLARRIPCANVVREDWMAQARPWLAAHAPHAALWSIPSHLGFWERPEAFNERFVRFLRSTRERSELAARSYAPLAPAGAGNGIGAQRTAATVG